MRSSLQDDVRYTASKVSVMTDQPKAQVLVVDDEQMLLDMVTDALTFAGYAVTAHRRAMELDPRKLMSM